MSKRQEYGLQFSKELKRDIIRFKCHYIGKNPLLISLAFKLTIMHKIECKGLIEEIINAENGEYYEQYFALDCDAASDNDCIEIAPPNVIIDNELTISFTDMKLLLQEYIDFMER